MKNKTSSIYFLTIILLSIMIFSCLRIPLNINTNPDTPEITVLSHENSYLKPCSLWVKGIDADGDKLSYQLIITDLSSGQNTQYTSYWTNYYESGKEILLTVSAAEGSYSLIVWSVDEMNAYSKFSDPITITFADLAPVVLEHLSGDTKLFPSIEGNYSVRYIDFEGSQISYRYDPGNGEPISNWSNWTSRYYFSYTYELIGNYLLKIQAKDSNENISDWSDGLSINVLPNISVNGYCSIPGSARHVVINNSIAYITSDGNGLQIIDVTIPSSPSIIGNAGSFNSKDLCYYENNVFLLKDGAFFDRYLYSYDVSDPSSPVLIDNIMIYDANCIDVDDYIIIVGTDDFGPSLSVIDISDPSSLVEISTINVGDVTKLSFKYPYVYIYSQRRWSWESNRLIIVDLSTPTLPIIASELIINDGGSICIGNDNILYLATSDSLFIYDVSITTNPIRINALKTLSDNTDIHHNENFLSIAHGTNGIELFDVFDQINPIIVGRYVTLHSNRSVFCNSDYLYSTDDGDGLLIFSYPEIQRNLNMEKQVVQNQINKNVLFNNGKIVINHLY